MFSLNKPGYNDVSWHDPSILSPNLESLAREGLIMEQSYVQPVCTPTRAALLTGYYPIHTGRQVQSTQVKILRITINVVNQL